MINFMKVTSLTLFNVLFKLIGFSLLIWIIDSLSNAINLLDSQIALITLILTLIGAVADLVIVPRYGNLPSLLMGFPAMTLIIWLVPILLPGGHISLVWAAFTTLSLGPVEYLLHRMILNSLASAN